MIHAANMDSSYADAETIVMTSSRTQVILIDDHAVVREGIRALIEETGDFMVLGEFGDGQSAISARLQCAPDVAVIDLKMPGLSAVETITGLRARWPNVHAMVFTSFGEDNQIEATLEAGAIGFLLKDAMGQDLLSALRSVARGEPWLHPSAQRQLMRMLRARPAQAESLTTREKDVLNAIAQGKSNKVIAAELGISEGTVKGYVSQLLEKTKLADRTQLALYASKQNRFD